MKALNIKYVGGLIKTISGLILFLPLMSNAEVNLKFIDGKKFTDYEVTGQSKNKSLVTIEKDLKKLITKLSQGFLTDKQALEIDVTNIDLPGMYRYAIGSRHQDLRVVEPHHPYKLDFNYRLKDSSGNVIQEGEYKLKEYSDLSLRNRMNSQLGTMGYYKKPLKKWFKTSFQKSPNS